MRKTYALVAVLALVGCENTATAAEGQRQAVPDVHADGVFEPLTVTPKIAVPSVRRVVPGLVAVRASVSEGPVTLIVRVTNGLGFAALTSGTEIIRFHQTAMAETQIATMAGNRYLLIAVPGESDPMLIDYSQATYTEFTP